MPSEPRDLQAVADWPEFPAKQVTLVIRLPRFVREQPFRVIGTDAQPGLESRKHTRCDRYPALASRATAVSTGTTSTNVNKSIPGNMIARQQGQPKRVRIARINFDRRKMPRIWAQQ